MSHDGVKKVKREGVTPLELAADSLSELHQGLLEDPSKLSNVI